MPCTALAKTDSEWRSFQFFQERTLSQLTDAFAEELWDRNVFQIAATEPSIRHALFALSGFHEQYLKPSHDSEKKQLGFALSQYNLAIRELLRFEVHKDYTSSILHLVSCLIFISIESLRGQYDNAIQLYRHGRQVIRECRKERPLSQEPERLLLRIEAIFTRLDIQIVPVIGHGAASWTASGGWDLQTSLPTLPSEFQSPSEAREALECFAYRYHAVLTEHREEEHIIAKHNEFIRRWFAMLDDLERRKGGTFTHAEKRGMAILRIHQVEVEISITTRKSNLPDRQRYEGLTQLFDDMLDKAEMAFRCGQPAESSIKASGNAPMFSMDTGIIPILYYIIIKCTEERVRQRAIDILHKSNRQEGIWNARQTALVAQRVVELEKLGNGELCYVSIEFHPGKQSGTAHFLLGETRWRDDLAW